MVIYTYICGLGAPIVIIVGGFSGGGYIGEINRQLEDHEVYLTLNKDPTNNFKDQFSVLIEKNKTEGLLKDRLADFLIITNSIVSIL